MSLKKRNRLINSIFLQVILIVIGFTLASMGLSVLLFRTNMKAVLMNEVGKKATVFLSGIETPVRRAMAGKESAPLTELVEEQAKFLGTDLNFAFVRAAVIDPEGRILDHTRPEKVGQMHSEDDLRKVMESGRPLLTREVKVLKKEPGKPEISVIKIVYPVRNRKGKVMGAIKADLDVSRTFDIIRAEYQRFNRRAILGFTIAAVLAILGMLFFLRRQIIGPVLSVAEASTRVAAGDMAVSIVPRGKNEIGDLVRSFNQMVEGLKQRDVIRESFGRYVTPEVAAKVLDSPDGLRLGGEKREMTILMADLRGFTKVSETLDAEAVVGLLNDYFGAMSEVIDHFGGNINEFLGDAILVFFGAPVFQEDHAARAAACALTMQNRMEETNVVNRAKGYPSLAMGIGLGTGGLVVGNLGSKARMKYGVVGPTINLAARIQSCAGPGEVLAMASTYEQIKDLVTAEAPVEYHFKGLKEPQAVYGLKAITAPAAVSLRVEDNVPSVALDLPLLCRRLEEKQIQGPALEGRVRRLNTFGISVFLKDAPPGWAEGVEEVVIIPHGGEPLEELYARVVRYIPAHEGILLEVKFSTLLPESWQHLLPSA
jgi:class 3 adenylate cyclase